MNTWLVVGLGNQAIRYQTTRHNLGARAVYEWSRGLTKKFSEKNWQWLDDRSGRFMHIDSIHCLLPWRGMNVAGEVVKTYIDKENILLSRIIIVHDELELSLGEVVWKESGTAAGHNGVRSIHQALNTRDIKRIRLGIGRPLGNVPVDQYVLEPFTEEEELVVPAVINKASQLLNESLGVAA